MSRMADEIEVDARGLACPLPIFRLAVAARTAPSGAVLHLVGTDAALIPDVTAWCEALGFELLRLDQPPGPPPRYEAWVRKP